MSSRIRRPSPQVTALAFAEGLTPSARRTPNALLADVAFEGCSLEGDDQAIVEVDECDAETSDGVIELRSVAFRRNALNGASAFSSRRSNCSSVEMVGVEFSGNTCGEACFARLSSASHLRKVVLSENVPVDAPRHTSALSLLHAASRSSTTVVGLNFSRNEIPGLHVTNGTLKLSSSFFVANSEGPLVRVESDSEAKIVNCSFDKNGNSNLRTETGHQKRTKRDEDSVLVGGQTSVMRGSAVSSIGGSARVRNCKFTDNQVRGDAGGLFASGGSLEIDNCTFKRNAATYSGGAIYVKETSVDISQLTCVSNSADNGGCLYAEDIWGYITHADISDNSARNGGGMCIVKSSVLGLEKTEVNANSTQSSGDVGAKRRPSFLCDTCVFKRNEAELAGGAIYANVSNLQRLVHHFDDCRFENNRAHLGGNAKPLPNLSSLFQYRWHLPHRQQLHGELPHIKRRLHNNSRKWEHFEAQCGRDGRRSFCKRSNGRQHFLQPRKHDDPFIRSPSTKHPDSDFA